ncbi:MAG: SCO family protein [Candidatus Latescibacterota bacterium]|nr:MAG: SCO family protein [Candidatus Latescibacterota bacterium]
MKCCVRAAALLLALLAAPAAAQPGVPTPLREVGFDQNLGGSVPLDARFSDEQGNEVELGRFFGERPVILSLVYYECPMLCSMALNGLVGSLRVLDESIGDEFEVVTVSFDPEETSALAAGKKQSYVASYAREGAADAWHFLTGEAESIRELTNAVGFRYVYDEQTAQFAHAAGIVLLTPEGKIARYFYGIEYPGRDLRLGLVEASEGRIGNVVDQVLLYCFQYNPETGSYAAVALNIVRLAAVLTIVGIALLLLVLRRGERRVRSQVSPTG